MMRAVKDAGLDELTRLRRRVLRSHAMNRIGRDDCDYIVARLDQIEVRIVEMREDDPKERDF